MSEQMSMTPATRAHGEIIDSLRSGVTPQSRISEMSPSDLAARAIAVSEILSLLQYPDGRTRPADRPGGNATDSDHQRYLLQQDALETAGYVEGQQYEHMGAVVRRLLDERTNLLEALQGRGDLSELDESQRTALQRAIVQAQDQEEMPDVLGDLAALDLRLRSEAVGEVVEAAPERAEAPLMPRLPAMRFQDFVLTSTTGELTTIMPGEVTVPIEMQDLFQEGADLNGLVSLMSEAAMVISRYGTDSEGLRNDQVAQRYAQDLAARIRGALDLSHSSLLNSNGTLTPLGERLLGPRGDGSGGLLGQLESGDLNALREITELPAMNFLFRQLRDVVVIRPTRVGFELWNLGLRMNIVPQSESQLRIMRNALEGNEEQRRALFGGLYANFSAGQAAIRGDIEVQRYEVQGDGSLARQDVGGRTVAAGTETIYEGGIEAVWHHLINRRVVTCTARVVVGGSTSVLEGTTATGEAARAEGSTFYIGTVGLDVTLERSERERRSFRFVNAGFQLTRPLTVPTSGTYRGTPIGSGDFLFYATGAYSARRGRWAFEVPITAGLGMIAQQTSSADILNSDPSIAVVLRVRPTATISIDRERWVELAMPSFSYSYLDGFNTFVVSTGVRAQVLEGLRLFGTFGWGYALGEGAPATLDSETRGVTVRGGVEIDSSLYRRRAIPRRAEVERAELTAEETERVSGAYGRAIDARSRDERAGAASALLEVLQTIPDERLIRSSRLYDDAIFSLESGDLQGALDTLGRIRAFREVEDQVRRERRRRE